MPYKFNPFTNELDYYESSKTVDISDGYIVENRILTAQEVIDKKLLLTNSPPVPSKVTLDIVSGTTQEYANDYIVVGQELSWNGLALELTLDTGDKLRIIYPI